MRKARIERQARSAQAQERGNSRHSSLTLIAVVVLVCSPSTVTTAKGSGSLKTSRLARESAATTVGERGGSSQQASPPLLIPSVCS